MVHEHILAHLLVEFSRIEGREAVANVLINAEQQVWNEAGWQNASPRPHQIKAEAVSYFAEIVPLLNRAVLYNTAKTSFR